jgi:hypothetical protein
MFWGNCTTIFAMQLMMVMMPIMLVSIRTGWVFNPSTAWLAVMATARLAQDDSPPEVPGQFVHFLWKGHRLVEVCEKFL